MGLTRAQRADARQISAVADDRGEAIPIRMGCFVVLPLRRAARGALLHRRSSDGPSRRRSLALRKSRSVEAPEVAQQIRAYQRFAGTHDACEGVWGDWYHKSFGVHGHPGRGELQ